MSQFSSISLEEMVIAWATDQFHRDSNSSHKRLMKKKFIKTEVDWKRVKFEYKPPIYSPPPPVPGTGIQKGNVLFRTTFVNHSETEQRCVFHCQRASKSVCTVSMEKCVTKGFEGGIKIGVPEKIAEASIGFKREVSVAAVNEETVEEELKWGVESEVILPMRTLAHAMLTIAEEEYQGSFEQNTIVTGFLDIVFHDVKHGYVLIKAIHENIYQIVQDSLQSCDYTEGAVRLDTDTKSVICSSKGKVKFRYGVKQEVVVERESLDNVPLTSI